MSHCLILGARTGPDGPSATLCRRAEAGLAIWRSGAVQTFVACGGGGEAEAIAGILTGAGVPEAAITLETASRNTAENLANAAPLLLQCGVAEVFLVSDWYHLPRALLAARRVGLNATGHSADWRKGSRLGQARAALREVPALAWYWWSLPRHARPY